MNPINIGILNRLAPYAVEHYRDEYIFRTDYDIEYAINFSYDPAFGGIPAYWFDLSNRSQKSSPNDPKVRDTIIRIIIEFFRANPDILLYMCDSANDQQAQRNRLFLRWFAGAEQSRLFCIKTAMIVDEEVENFIAMIVPRHHPYLEEILAHFEEEISMFRTNKPQ